jgi:hypothetical protein
MSQSFAERRKHPRATAGSDFFVQLRGPEPAHPLRVKDISVSGVCCHSDVAIPEMTRVYMEIALPGDRHKNGLPFNADGAVVRCQPRTLGSGFDVAIFFLQISEESRAAILRFVESRLARAVTFPEN